jgi:hypothetical protein
MNWVRLQPVNGTEEERCSVSASPSGSGPPDSTPVFFRHTAILSIIRPFFGQNWSAGGWSTGHPRMTLDGKGNANELHT